jgi:hypothetical protein
VQVLVPDGPELRRAEQRHKSTLSLLGDSVSIGAISGTRKNEVEQLGAFFFGNVTKDSTKKEVLTKDADIYLMVNASAIELPVFERFVNETAPKGATVVAFNLEARQASALRCVAGMLARAHVRACVRVQRLMYRTQLHTCAPRPPFCSLRRRAATWVCPASRARTCTCASCLASSPRCSCASARTPKR